MKGTNVLVVEDDPDLRRLLTEGLDREGFEVRAVANGTEALAASEQADLGLLVIDIGLPDADGRDLCQALRSRGHSAPVLFLTAKDALTDRLSGFSAGGDDYLTKPFAFAELVARLRALDRRLENPGNELPGDLLIDPVELTVGCGSESVSLTPTEFKLIGRLAADPGQTLRRRELVAAAWPDGAIVHDNTLDVYIGRLRRKLSQLPTEATVTTVHGVGYVLK
ncbi:MAG: response regulator transcription factor [Solirubrobacterales bacterium]